jgi:spore germination protein KA
MTAPFLFIENFQAPQDYYTNYYYASIIRILRISALIITTGLPAIYLSLVTYHREVLPSSLLLSILSSRQGVPFPTVVELIGLLFIFEILIEAGSRMPNYIGQALSIVGALVLGSSAVEAKIVSAAMIIVVGVSSITGLIIPNLAGIFIILRTLFILFSSTYGMYGYVLGMAGLFIHLFSLESFGVPYMATVNSLYKWDLKDTLIRAPKWFIQKYKYGGRK